MVAVDLWQVSVGKQVVSAQNTCWSVGYVLVALMARLLVWCPDSYGVNRGWCRGQLFEVLYVIYVYLVLLV